MRPLPPFRSMFCRLRAPAPALPLPTFPIPALALLALPFLAFPLLALSAAPVGAIELKPHRAVYSLKLASAEAGSGVVDAQGAMVFEWAESCESWITRQRARFDVFSPEGNSVRTEVSFSSWEGKSSGRYGFNLRTLQDGRVVEEMRGEAALNGERTGSGDKAEEGDGGIAVYTHPEQQRLVLPVGTLFPVAHTRLLIEQAAAGRNNILRPVFLGQREDEPMDVNALVTRRPAGARPPLDGHELLSSNAWSFHLAFFGPEDDLLPSFEIHETLHDNGVVADATVIYDEFAFAYTLERLESLPAPKC